MLFAANQDFIHFHPTGKAVTVRPNHNYGDTLPFSPFSLPPRHSSAKVVGP
jgi:hypothetical protein